MVIKNILNGKTLKNNSLNIENNSSYSDLKINKIVNQSVNRKILYDANKNPKVILKVKEVSSRTLFSLNDELIAYKRIKNKPFFNICKKIKTIACLTDKNVYEALNKTHLTLCKSGVDNIPIIINILEYVEGESFYTFIQNKKNMNIVVIRDFMIQLFMILYFLYQNGVIYQDINLNNFIIQKNPHKIQYHIDGFIYDEHFEYLVRLIDLDKVVFSNVCDNMPQEYYVVPLLQDNGFFYKIIMSLRSKFELIINFSKLNDLLFWKDTNNVNTLVDLLKNISLYAK